MLHRWRQRAIDGSLDLEGALAVGRDVEAGSIVWGSVVSVGAEVRLTAELYSVKGMELARGRAEGPADSLLALVDSLGLDLLRKIWLAREPIPNLRVSGVTTGSVDAIRAYLRGQQHYRRSDWDSARVAFGEAVEADSTFALAHFRLGLAYGWSPGYGFGSSIARRHGQLALDYADRLPPRERMLMQAHALFQDGKVEAHDSMKRYVAIYPDDPEGWYELGDVRYHALPLLDLTFDDLVGPFDRVLELDPSLAPAMVHPLELAVTYGDSATFNRYFAKFEAAADSSYVQPYSVGKLYWEDPDSFLIAIANVEKAGARLDGAAMMGSYRSSEKTPDFILSGFRALLQSPDLSDRDRYQMLAMSARILASLGRLEESAQLYDTLWAINPNPPEASEIMGAVIAGIADSSFAARVFSIMASPPPIPGVDQLVQYFQAQYALSRGRSAEARRLIDQALAADTSMFPNLMPHLLSAEQGWADIIDGDTVGGIEKMKAGLNEAGYGPGPQMNYSQALRFALSSALAARPETRQEGIRRLRSSYWFGDVLIIPLAYFLLGQALEAEGDAAGAARAYAQFIHLWENADPELQPRVESARRALQRLSAEDVN